MMRVKSFALYQPQICKIVCAARSFSLAKADTQFGRYCIKANSLHVSLASNFIELLVCVAKALVEWDPIVKSILRSPIH
jgi:hypothetical protein